MAFGPPGVLILPVGNHGKVFTNEGQRRLAVGAFDTLPLMSTVLIIIIINIFIGTRTWGRVLATLKRRFLRSKYIQDSKERLFIMTQTNNASRHSCFPPPPPPFIGGRGGGRFLTNGTRY